MDWIKIFLNLNTVHLNIMYCSQNISFYIKITLFQSVFLIIRKLCVLSKGHESNQIMISFCNMYENEMCQFFAEILKFTCLWLLYTCDLSAFFLKKIFSWILIIPVIHTSILNMESWFSSIKSPWELQSLLKQGRQFWKSKWCPYTNMGCGTDILFVLRRILARLKNRQKKKGVKKIYVLI